MWVVISTCEITWSHVCELITLGIYLLYSHQLDIVYNRQTSYLVYTYTYTYPRYNIQSPTIFLSVCIKFVQIAYLNSKLLFRFKKSKIFSIILLAIIEKYGASLDQHMLFKCQSDFNRIRPQIGSHVFILRSNAVKFLNQF